MSQYLDLVALGTYADVASLDYNNRILVDVGLKRIQQHLCRPGISALLEIAGREAATLKAQDLGFVLGPRINAAGRMETMDIGIECLLAQDFASAYPLAEQLNQLNVERRQVEATMKQEALIALDQIQLDDTVLPAALIMFEPHWHQGVIGIVAGRLKNSFIVRVLCLLQMKMGYISKVLPVRLKECISAMPLSVLLSNIHIWSATLVGMLRQQV